MAAKHVPFTKQLTTNVNPAVCRMQSSNKASHSHVFDLNPNPNMRAHVKRFGQTLKVECPDRFVIVAERQLNYGNREWRLHYNRERPHGDVATYRRMARTHPHQSRRSGREIRELERIILHPLTHS